MIDTVNTLWIQSIERKLKSGELTETITYYSDNLSVRAAIAKLASRLGFAHLSGSWHGKMGVKVFPNSAGGASLNGTTGEF